jgi:hypothetical protein
MREIRSARSMARLPVLRLGRPGMAARSFGFGGGGGSRPASGNAFHRPLCWAAQKPAAIERPPPSSWLSQPPVGPAAVVHSTTLKTNPRQRLNHFWPRWVIALFVHLHASECCRTARSGGNAAPLADRQPQASMAGRPGAVERGGRGMARLWS